jgi:predicted transcriptional regulator
VLPDTFTDAETRVLLALVDAGWATVRELAGRCGMTVTRTHSALKYLQACGVVKRDNRPQAPFVANVEFVRSFRHVTDSEGSV